MNMKPDTIRVGLFRDRREAGRLLAAKLANNADRPDVVVLAQPRGGVPVAYEVASALDLPLDVFVVRKLGIPDMTNWQRVRSPQLACACSTISS
jgi:predicted phosphoribosyltransferase